MSRTLDAKDTGSIPLAVHHFLHTFFTRSCKFLTICGTRLLRAGVKSLHTILIANILVIALVLLHIFAHFAKTARLLTLFGLAKIDEGSQYVKAGIMVVFLLLWW